MAISSARFRGGLAINQPWRLLVFLAVVFVSLMGGFRSVAIILGLTLLFLFHLEGLFRSKLLPVLVMLGISSWSSVSLWWRNCH